MSAKGKRKQFPKVRSKRPRLGLDPRCLRRPMGPLVMMGNRPTMTDRSRKVIMLNKACEQIDNEVEEINFDEDEEQFVVGSAYQRTGLPENGRFKKRRGANRRYCKKFPDPSGTQFPSTHIMSTQYSFRKSSNLLMNELADKVIQSVPANPVINVPVQYPKHKAQKTQGVLQVDMALGSHMETEKDQQFVTMKTSCEMTPILPPKSVEQSTSYPQILQSHPPQAKQKEFAQNECPKTVNAPLSHPNPLHSVKPQCTLRPVERCAERAIGKPTEIFVKRLLSDFHNPLGKLMQNFLLEGYGLNPVLLSDTNHIAQLRKLFADSLKPPTETAANETQSIYNWVPIVNSARFVDKAEETESCSPKEVKYVHIADTPRVKIIAEKFARFKKNNIEVRQHESKIVCLEYDIYKNLHYNKPAEVMRAYFLIKTGGEDEDGSRAVPGISSKMKKTFHLNDEEIKKLTEKEIAIIDGKISENKPYLRDLKRVLRKRQMLNDRKNKTSLDLLSMYEMARNDSPPLDYNFSSTNLLSEAELNEIKALILQNSSTSINGVHRIPLKTTCPGNKAPDHTLRSESLMYDVIRSGLNIENGVALTNLFGTQI